MGIWEVLLDVVILLGVGALLGGLLERMRQSAIIGYLLAGALLGPNALQLIESTDEVLEVSELGIALLLFAIGLEFSWPRLRGMGPIPLGGGALQVVVTTAAGAAIGLAVGLEPPAAVAMGAIATLSSTACVLRLLAARGEIESVHGGRALGVLLVQDIAVVPLVLLVTVLAEGGTAGEMIAGIARTLGIGLGLVGVLYFAFDRVVPRLLETGPMHSNRELPLLVAVVSGLGSGLVAHAAGVSPALGAFVAGMLLGRSPLAVQVRSDVSSLKTLLMTLFFTSMGMLSDPGWIARNAALVTVVVAGVVAGKALIAWLVLRVVGARDTSAIATGVCLGQIGEFSFVLAEIGRGSILGEDAFLLVVSTTVITMVLTPYLVTSAPSLAARLTRGRPAMGAVVPRESDGRPLTIVIGFGPAGRAASERIAELGSRIAIIDQNPAATRDARRLGYDAVAGDARHGEVLEHAGLRQASHVVVTVPGQTLTGEIVRYLRMAAPEACVLARARFHRSLPDVRAAGAHVVVDEEQEVGRLLADAYERINARPVQEAS